MVTRECLINLIEASKRETGAEKRHFRLLAGGLGREVFLEFGISPAGQVKLVITNDSFRTNHDSVGDAVDEFLELTRNN